MNVEFWDEMVFLIGPRLNEFSVQQINQILSSAANPKIGKKSAQRILIAFAMQGIDLAKNFENQNLLNNEMRKLLRNSNYIFEKKNFKEILATKVKANFPRNKFLSKEVKEEIKKLKGN